MALSCAYRRSPGLKPFRREEVNAARATTHRRSPVCTRVARRPYTAGTHLIAFTVSGTVRNDVRSFAQSDIPAPRTRRAELRQVLDRKVSVVVPLAAPMKRGARIGVATP